MDKKSRLNNSLNLINKEFFMVLINAQMIAPCGINCSVCFAHLRQKNQCPGCLSEDEEHKMNHCKKCSIRFCIGHDAEDFVYCSECSEFPCKKIINIDKRYVTKYHTSLINNLLEIKENGMEEFLADEQHKWTCPHCGGILSIHKDFCETCKTIYR